MVGIKVLASGIPEDSFQVDTPTSNLNSIPCLWKSAYKQSSRFASGLGQNFCGKPLLKYPHPIKLRFTHTQSIELLAFVILHPVWLHSEINSSEGFRRPLLWPLCFRLCEALCKPPAPILLRFSKGTPCLTTSLFPVLRVVISLFRSHIWVVTASTLVSSITLPLLNVSFQSPQLP